MVDIFETCIQAAANAAIPVSSDRIHPHRVPWWTPECTRLNNERKRALRRYQHTRLVCDKISYNRARARAQYIKNETRKNSWQNYVSTLNMTTPMTQIWARIMKMTGKNKSTMSPSLNVGNHTITDSSEVALTLARHYAHISSGENYLPSFQRNKPILEAQPLNFATNIDYYYNSPITPVELLGTLKQSKNTAPGEDNITYSMIQNIHPSLFKYILQIYNNIWRNGSYPSVWRRALVLSFLKPGKPSDATNSYRPIALTSCAGKLLEKVVNVRLVNYLESNHHISPTQYGFRKMHSTIDSLTRLTTDRKEQAVCVFFDLEKAYDTTWRFGIIKTLYQYGLRGPLPIFIRNFLQNLTFKTKINQSTSVSHVQQEGVPQGSVLSCTLFGVVINGMPRDVKCALYVDDLAIYTSSSYVPALEKRRLQRAINNVTTWATGHGFQFSVHFHRKRGLTQEPSLFLNDTPIHFKPETKFLGLILDNIHSTHKNSEARLFEKIEHPSMRLP